MRVLMVANTLPPADISGVGEQVMQLTAGLRELGIEVEVLGRGPDGVRGPKLFFPLMAIFPVLRAVKQFSPNVVQVHESDGALAALVLAVTRPLLSTSPRIITLFQVSYWRELLAVRRLIFSTGATAHPTWSERRFRWIKAPLHLVLGWLSSSVSDQILAPSRMTAGELFRDYRNHEVQVLPNVMGRKEVETSAVLAGPDSGGFLLFVGRLRIRKGVDILLEACKLIHEGGRPCTLVIAGDGEHKKKLEARAQFLGISSSVFFLGRCTPGQVGYLLEKARALVVPSLYEGMPLVILEAMEKRTPVVASQVSGIPEVVKDGETGWLIEPGSLSDLSTTLTEVLANVDEAQKRGQMGKQRLDSHFRPKHAAQQWLDFQA